MEVLLARVRCSFFDQSGNFLGPGSVDRVAGAGNFDFVTPGSCGVPPFEVGVNRSVFSRHQHPTWFASPRSRGDDRFEIVGQVEYLRARHESSLLSRQVGGEVLVKLGGVEICETIRSLLYCTRFAEVTGEALSVVRLILSSIWHVSCDVHQTGNGRIRSSLGNYGSPVAVSDKNARSILQSKDPLGGSHVFFERGFRLLDDADLVTVLSQNVGDAFPPRAICPSAMNQNNIANAMFFVLRCQRATSQQHQCDAQELRHSSYYPYSLP